MKSYNLSKENKKLRARFIKAHLRLRALAYENGEILLLNKIWGEIGFDNAFFWKTVFKNLGYLPSPTTRIMRDLYFHAQTWYNEWRKQEFKEDKWLDFADLKWKEEERSFDSFWKKEVFDDSSTHRG